ncbi:MAG: plasmid mobilization protein [Oscillospiraceae bacterium]
MRERRFYRFPGHRPGQAERPAVLAETPLFTGGSPNPLNLETESEIMSKQRRRDTTLTIRLTKAEKERIERNAKRAERSITDYLVLLSLEMPIHVAEDVKPLLIELKRIGNNLNQITAKINAGTFRSYNFEDMIDGQKKIYEQLLSIARKG